MGVCRRTYWCLLYELIYLLFNWLRFFLVFDLDWRTYLTLWKPSSQILSVNVLFLGFLNSLIKNDSTLVVRLACHESLQYLLVLFQQPQSSLVLKPVFFYMFTNDFLSLMFSWKILRLLFDSLSKVFPPLPEVLFLRVLLRQGVCGVTEVILV